ncbi:MAG: hypothetical protein A2Y12_08145 [Planctomycetes bacterium GWF2_42_9]|nr:MAG: hypothetical protein A2Y12_08145 [Planctomycetes bacterium GWF2_42_9]HBG26341.1 hypothetical protein [Phycisphaerales bacterium]
MELKRIEQLSLLESRTTFKLSILPYILLTLFFLSLGCVLCYAFYQDNGPIKVVPRIFFIAFAFLALFFIVMSFGMMKKVLSANNWLMLADLERVFIRIRVFWYAHITNDERVIDLRYSEIKSVRITKLKEIYKGRDESSASYKKCIDICLKNFVPDEIFKAIEGERTINEKISYYDPTVWVKDQNIVRIHCNFMTPSVVKAVKFFGQQGIVIESYNYEEIDITNKVASLMKNTKIGKVLKFFNR